MDLRGYFEVFIIKIKIECFKDVYIKFSFFMIYKGRCELCLDIY